MQLNLPEHQFTIKKSANGLTIFDVLRSKFVALTPEEWVRQNFVAFLIHHKQFPQALMGNEIALVQNDIKRRCDTVRLPSWNTRHRRWKSLKRFSTK